MTCARQFFDDSCPWPGGKKIRDNEEYELFV